jgi:hypothetical protein
VGAAAGVFDLQLLESSQAVASDADLHSQPTVAEDPQSPAANFPVVPRVHGAVFAFSGWLALGSFAIYLVRSFKQFALGGLASVWPSGTTSSSRRHMVILLAWTVGYWYLGTLNGPFVAPRYIVPCLLSVTLGILALPGNDTKLARTSHEPQKPDAQARENKQLPSLTLRASVDRPSKAGWVGENCGPGRVARSAGVVLTAALGLAVAAGDAQWAGIYREWAGRLAERYRADSGTTYFVGHWGWQYYAERAGMVAFDPRRTRLQPGDLLIIPLQIDRPTLPVSVLQRCRMVAREQVTAGSWLPRTYDPEGRIFFYADNRRDRIPWGWSTDRHPHEVFVILRYGG